MSELPRGWASATISDLIGPDGLFRDGDWVETKDQDPAGDVRLTQLADVGDGSFRDRSNRFLRTDQAERLRCTVLEPGDVLVARMPDPLGRACLFPGLQQAAVTAVDVCIVRPGSASVESRWLMWAINSPGFRASVAALQTGTTRKRISRKNLASIGLPVPPLAEQRRVVMVIEELFARLDSADRELVKARARVRRLRETTLDNRIWRSAGNHVTIDRLAELIRGVTYKKHEARDQPAPESAPLLRATNINVTLFLDSDLVYIPRSRVAKAQVLRSGDIVIATSSGSAAVVGKSAVLREHWDGTFGAFCAVLRASPGVDSSYLALVLRTRRIRERWSELARGTNINNLRAMHILQTEIPLPPYEEQRKIVSILEQELSLTDSLSAAAESTHRRSAALRRSILEHAFRGELVAQDPDDEPASALLERIHAERAAAPPRLRRRRVST